VNEQLLAELTKLRHDALAAVHPGASTRVNGSGAGSVESGPSGPMGGRLLHFPDGRDVCVVASTLPADRLDGVAQADPQHPNHVGLLRYADGDALIEMYGHLRAENPSSKVTFTNDSSLTERHLSQHVVILGGDFNRAAHWLSQRVQVPWEVREPDGDDLGLRLMVGAGEDRRIVQPTFLNGTGQLQYDIGCFVRGPNPANLQATVTWCFGVFSRGTFGAVRLLTDAQLRVYNEQEIEDFAPGTFGHEGLEWLMFRVPVVVDFTQTPDLSHRWLRIAHGTATQEPGLPTEHSITWLEGAPPSP
jgi:hypothetical protein